MIRKEARTPPGFLFVILLNLRGGRDIFYKPSGKKIPPAIGRLNLPSPAWEKRFLDAILGVLCGSQVKSGSSLEAQFESPSFGPEEAV